MTNNKNSQPLDLSELDCRIRTVFKKMRIITVGDLLEIDELELRAWPNIGPVTLAKVLQLQAEHGKDLSEAATHETISQALANSRIYTNRLITVALASKDIITYATRDLKDRYYYRITTKRFNILKKTLNALRKPKS